MNRRHEIVRTRSGAAAMRSLAEQEVMHPGVGPLIEAEQLYVRQSRLVERMRTPGLERLVVFDVGLGAGSNALAAWAVGARAPRSTPTRLELVSFERDLGALELALAQDHDQAADFGLVGASAEAARALLAHGRVLTPRASWRLERGDVVAALTRESSRADIVFWDPFSPRANPDLWTVAAFAAVRRTAGARATLFTYSASTAVRIALLLAGWSVGVGDGIGEKAFTTAAAVDWADLARPLERSWLARLGRADVPLPADAPRDFAQRVASLAQFAR
jgi:queuine tRNA-ribosyltransferase